MPDHKPGFCTICNFPLEQQMGVAIIGDGDGRMTNGGRFAHVTCYWEREAIRLKDQLDALKRLASRHFSTAQIKQALEEGSLFDETKAGCRAANSTALDQSRRAQLSAVMMRLPTEFAMRWCTSRPCACLGCANGPETGAGNLEALGFTEGEWHQWWVDQLGQR